MGKERTPPDKLESPPDKLMNELELFVLYIPIPPMRSLLVCPHKAIEGLWRHIDLCFAKRVVIALYGPLLWSVSCIKDCGSESTDS